MENKRQTGSQGEEMAEAYLIAKGFQVMERNFFCSYGEIDRIFKDGDMLVFVEVKYRRSARYGAPGDAVTAVKQGRMARAAQEYLRLNGLEDIGCRFDVIEIIKDNGDWHIQHHKDAFWL